MSKNSFDKLKYIPGDLAMVGNYIVKFMTRRTNYFLKITNYDVVFSNGNVYRYSSNELKPIPLTSEILQNNGWKEDGAWFRLNTQRAYLYITKDAVVDDEFLVCVGDDKHNLTSISFVHELQHLLYGLKLNSEMEV